MFRFLLYPFSFVYRMVISLRNFLYESKVFKQYEFDIPIISVGNLTIGGTGKTPQSEYLIELLQDQFQVAYLSRGYKRKTRGFVLATDRSDTQVIGDEAVQIKQKFPKVPVAVCENRVLGIRKLLADKTLKIDVIILDDAFQHRKVKSNINILLIDYTRPISEDSLLPVGRLREPVSAHYRANMIIFTKCPDRLQPIDQRIIKNKLNVKPYQSLFFSTIVYGEISPAIKGSGLFSDDMRKYSVLLITGIANPKPLIDYLREQVGQIVHKAYPDHHQFSQKEINSLAEEFNRIESAHKMIITTEKDLSRIRFIPGLPEHFIENLFYIPIKVKFLDRTKDQFNTKIKNYVTENKSNSRLHQR